MAPEPIRAAHVARGASSLLVLPRRRVLVAAFHDWEQDKNGDLFFDPAKKWHCIKNPSGRLLLGTAYKEDRKPKDDEYTGPLVKYLKESAEYTRPKTVNNVDLQPIAIDWVFDTMPVDWGVAEAAESKTSQYIEYDVIVGLGLGVYRHYERFILEYGAQGPELRLKPTDAKFTHSGIAERMNEFIPAVTKELDDEVTRDVRSGFVQAIYAHPSSALSDITTDYTVYIEPAGTGNNFICNNMHYITLEYLNKSLNYPYVRLRSRLRQVYFIHMPYASAAGDPNNKKWDATNWSSNADYANLARGIGPLIHELVSF